MFTKQHILKAIGSIAQQLGRAPSKAEFISHSGISAYFVLQWFRTWSDAVRRAGLRPYTRNARIESRAMLEDWGEAVRRNRGTLPRHIYLREGTYNPCTLAKRFGGWTRVPETFRQFAKGRTEWADVVALLPAGVAVAAESKKDGINTEGTEGRGHRVHREEWRGLSGKAASANAQINWGRAEAHPYSSVPRMQLSTHLRHRALKGRMICGNPMEFGGLRHEPVNEQGVVLLFGMVAEKLGYKIEGIQNGFPDCEAKRKVGPDRWQRVNIEFEFESRNFRSHGHPETGCDVIVCWRHNWPECPKHIEILELSSVIRSLSG